MNQAKNIVLGLCITLTALFLTAPLRAGDSCSTAEMTGQWEGRAKIIVNWCQQKELPVSLNITSDGAVTGYVGDATLTRGRLEKNRGWFGRKLNLATDYIIKGDLTGPVIASEAIVRESVSIPLNFTDGLFKGGVHTSGSKIGGKDNMILSASSLSLSRIK